MRAGRRERRAGRSSAGAWVLCAAGVLLLFAPAVPAAAHPAPFSYLDVRLDADALAGSLTVHAIDVAHELGVEMPERLLAPTVAEAQADRFFAIIAQRFAVRLDGVLTAPALHRVRTLPDRQALRFEFGYSPPAEPATVAISGHLFPYDPNHQTFVNIYESGQLTHQAILNAERTTAEHFTGTRQGIMAVVARFVASGIHHIVIGPDHILFLIGLLLLGGGAWPLLRIVTAFTVAHSITLSLAALDVLTPSARIVEPAIALSIVYVGADNLLVAKDGRDVRAWIAFGFGLIHGFGFASVLKELDLPRQALGWSLFSFNVGVEIGQVCIVLLVASLLAVIRRRSPALDRRVVVVGSAVVMAAGAYWFVERVFLTGGGL